MKQWLSKLLCRFEGLSSVALRSVKTLAELETSSGSCRVKKACASALSHVAQSALCQAPDGNSARAQEASMVLRPCPDVMEDLLNLLAQWSAGPLGGALSGR